MSQLEDIAREKAGMVNSWEKPDLRGRDGLKSALYALMAPRRVPTEADAPKLTTFPMTPAARAALHYSYPDGRC